MVIAFGEILNRGYPATRKELISIYRDQVSAAASDIFVRMCSEGELRRLVFIGVYAKQYTAYDNRGMLIRKLCAVAGVGKTSGFKYAADYDKTRSRAVK